MSQIHVVYVALACSSRTDAILAPTDVSLGRLTAQIGAKPSISNYNKNTKVGALVHPVGDRKVNIPEEFDIREHCMPKENGPKRTFTWGTLED